MSDLTEALNRIIPKTLDDVIRTNRHLVELRLATNDELSAIAGDISETMPKDEISNYRLVSICIKNPGAVSVHLLGTSSAGYSWATSGIVKLDIERGYALTKTGSIYKLLGALQHDEPDFDDLACFCAVMNQWGLAKYLGIPPFFY